MKEKLVCVIMCILFVAAFFTPLVYFDTKNRNRKYRAERAEIIYIHSTSLGNAITTVRFKDGIIRELSGVRGRVGEFVVVKKEIP